MDYADFKISVSTSDGVTAGRLSGVEGPFMRVARGWLRRPLWIPTEYISEATPRDVTLSVPADALPRFAAVHPLPAPQPERASREAA